MGVDDLLPDLDALAPPGVHLAGRAIVSGDEALLVPEEAAALARSTLVQRRHSGAARDLARTLLLRLEASPAAIPRGPSGAPIWPEGVVGSLAHDEDVALAALARRADIAALGVDVEPAEPLAADLAAIVGTVAERAGAPDDPLYFRKLFVAKEAVYKALFPLDGRFREHRDVEIDLAAGVGAAEGAPPLDLAVGVARHIVVVATIRGAGR